MTIDIGTRVRNTIYGVIAFGALVLIVLSFFDPANWHPRPDPSKTALGFLTVVLVYSLIRFDGDAFTDAIKRGAGLVTVIVSSYRNARGQNVTTVTTKVEPPVEGPAPPAPPTSPKGDV